MNKIIIIHGTDADFNAEVAVEMIINHSFVTLPGIHYNPYSPFKFSEVTEDTEYILIHNVPAKRMPVIIHSLMSPDITIERKGHAPKTIPKPKIIITVCRKSPYVLPKGDSYSRRFEVKRAQKVRKISDPL